MEILYYIFSVICVVWLLQVRDGGHFAIFSLFRKRCRCRRRRFCFRNEDKLNGDFLIYTHLLYKEKLVENRNCSGAYVIEQRAELQLEGEVFCASQTHSCV